MYLVIVRVTGVFVVPFVRAEPGQEEHGQGNHQERDDHIHPDIEGERVEEGEHTRVLRHRNPVQDGDAQMHVRLGEVYYLLPDVADGKRCYNQVCLLYSDSQVRSNS